MNQWTTFFAQYGMTILCTVLTALAGTIGAQLKRLVEKHLTDKTKRSIVLSCVKAVEQLYGTLGGEEKKRKAIEYVCRLLKQVGCDAPLQPESFFPRHSTAHNRGALRSTCRGCASRHDRTCG